MPSHGRNNNNGNNKRHRHGKGHNDDVHARTDEGRADSYSRHHRSSQQGDNYRASSSSRRASYDYDIAGAASSSRSRDWYPADGRHDRYDPPVGEDYYRRPRDEYGVEGWRRPASPAAYPPPADDWGPPYHPAYPSQFDDPGWIAARGFDRGRRDSPPPPTHHLADYRRDKDAGKRKQDSGWEGRHTQEKEAPKLDADPATEDRSWQPAASWRANHDDSTSNKKSSQNGHRNSNSNNKNSKNGKKSQNYTRAKRDWRLDDGNLNNWDRREFNDFADDKSSKSSRRRQQRSLSRSRSPAESYYSHYSRAGRSRSRTASPPPSKRRRKDFSPSAPRSPTPPEDRGRMAFSSQYDSHANGSPPRRSPKHRGRRDSLTSRSSISSERSPSESPDRPRAVHRLPTVSSAITSFTYSGTNNSNLLQEGKKKANGKSKRSKKRNQQQHQHQFFPRSPEPAQILLPRQDAEPLLIPAKRYLEETKEQRPPDTMHVDDLPPTFVRPQVRPTTFVPASTAEVAPVPPPNFIPAKRAGFRPIGQASSSLRKFFPGDEEEDMQTSPLPEAPSDQSLNSTFTESTPVPMQRAEPQIPAASSTVSVPPSPGQQNTMSSDPPLPESHTGTARSPSNVVMAPPERVPTPPSSRPSKSRDLYSIVSQVGEGTFGKVYKARNTVSQVHVALKRIRMESEKDGFPVTAMREIKLLQSLRHVNVVRLYEMMVSNGSVYMVFEYMDHDLTGILSQSQFSFTDAHLKSLCYQMLAGLAYLHHKGVIHRDIKGSNILINNRGELKLADFGLARFYQKRRRADYTNRVITLWYRPPELLFGATVYGPEVDMWSAGCIMLELYTRKPVFQGNDEIDQLDVIYRIFGTPTPERWPDVLNLPWYELVKPKEPLPNRFRDYFQRWMTPPALDLAEMLLTYDPTRRVSAAQAMETPYFTEEQPSPEKPEGLASVEGEWHELKAKKEKERARRKRREENAVQ